MLTMSCVDYDPGCSGYSDAMGDYYPDLEALSEALAEGELKKIWPVQPLKQQGFILLKRLIQRQESYSSGCHRDLLI